MNIVIVVSSLSIGGAEKQVVEDANLLSKHHNVFVLTFIDGPLRKFIDSSIRFVLMERRDYLRTALKLASFIREHKISIVHAHLYAPMVLSAIAGRITRTPVVWNFHSHAYENSLKGKILHKYTASLSSVKRILFPATELDKYYNSQGYGFSRKKCQLAYNSGQEMSYLHPNKPFPANKLIRIGFIGRVIPLKRIHLLIELAQYLIEKEIRNFIIDVVGDGSELVNLVQQITESNLESFVKFYGFRDDTLSFYSEFDIFALPSREEVLSLSLIDAGLSGLPSVAFNVGGNNEIISDGQTGFLVDTEEDFFNRIILLIKDVDLRKRLGDKALCVCLNKFSKEARLKKLNDLYEEAIQIN